MTEYVSHNADAEKTGRDLNLVTGRGDGGRPDGHFRFFIGGSTAGQEVLTIDPVGRFYVNGKHVTDDMLVYQAFRLWLSSSSFGRDPADSVESEGISNLRAELKAAQDEVARLKKENVKSDQA